MMKEFLEDFPINGRMMANKTLRFKLNIAIFLNLLLLLFDISYLLFVSALPYQYNSNKAISSVLCFITIVALSVFISWLAYLFLLPKIIPLAIKVLNSCVESLLSFLQHKKIPSNLSRFIEIRLQKSNQKKCVSDIKFSSVLSDKVPEDLSERIIKVFGNQSKKVTSKTIAGVICALEQLSYIKDKVSDKDIICAVGNEFTKYRINSYNAIQPELNKFRRFLKSDEKDKDDTTKNYLGTYQNIFKIIEKKTNNN